MATPAEVKAQFLSQELARQAAEHANHLADVQVMHLYEVQKLRQTHEAEVLEIRQTLNELEAYVSRLQAPEESGGEQHAPG